MKQTLVILGLIFLLADCAIASERDVNELTTQTILAEFTFETDGYTIILPIRFKGEEYLFIFDTGASYTGFDTSLKPLLGDAKRTEMVNKLGGAISLEFFDAPKAFLGPFNIQDCGKVVCMDLEILMLSSIEDRKISGFIGMDFLKNHVIQINFDKGTLAFLKPKKDKGIFSFLQNKSGKNAWGEKLNLKYSSGGNPYIKGDISSVCNSYFMIDTGANINLLENKIFEKTYSKKNNKTPNNSNQAASITAQNGKIRIGDFSVGNLKYQGLIFHKGQMSFLGVPFLSRHIVTFDFPNSKVYLKKGRDFRKVDEEDMSGLHLLRISNETVVHSVDEDSPASQAGIRANDVILKINGKDANTYNIWKLRRLFKSGDKNKITVTIKRSKELQQVSFLLEKKI